MKTTIGGDRLGSGNKQEISAKHYSRSTHDLGYTWRSSMSAGTLVPFLRELALPGDSWDINLMTEVLTLPTIGPLFGGFKVQLDVFAAPIRLYNAALHMNKLGVGMEMNKVFLPRMKVSARNDGTDGRPLEDNKQINPSCLLKYLEISGIGKITSGEGVVHRYFNAVMLLAYWDTYKNYYANKQEERGFCIHTDDASIARQTRVIGAQFYRYQGGALLAQYNIFEQTRTIPLANGDDIEIIVQFSESSKRVNGGNIQLTINGVTDNANEEFSGIGWGEKNKVITMGLDGVSAESRTWRIDEQNVTPVEPISADEISPQLVEFDLKNIDTMRERILQHSPLDTPFVINDVGLEPYSLLDDTVTVNGNLRQSIEYGQEMLGIKTYQSDLFNNWINTEWIDGANGVNEVTKVDTTGDSFTIDALNLASKVYVMLNRIAISGGTYDDWLDSVYTHKRRRGIESPMYLGSLIRELGFQEVVSNADTSVGENDQPLGTLAGRGKLNEKNKGGRIRYKCDEPSYILGIVSITPRIDYSQGNKWDVNLDTMDDLHKPALDAIGFQELVTEQMAWQSTELNFTAPDTVTLTKRSVGKQPAWINYMTNVNKTYGNFAIESKEMFMTLNRKYDINPSSGIIEDLTTYIDPTKFNQIFAQTNIDAQNFWVQIGAQIKARRKMSAKVIPNL